MRHSAAFVLPLALAAAGFEGPRLVSGSAPAALNPNAVAGAEVLLLLKVSAGGAVSELMTLRDGPPFTDALREAAGRWRFEPAKDAGAAVPAAVLVAGVFRPPDLVGTAPPRTRPIGERPSCDEIPNPVELVTPPYPPQGQGDHVVLAEAWVEKDGRVGAVKVLEGLPPFAGAASEAAQRWRFRPACRADAAVPARTYLVFGFRAPVALPPIRR